jgi:hypothetical protein
MNLRTLLIFTLVLSLFAAQTVIAQQFWYSGAFLGFKSIGLEGAIRLTTSAGTFPGNTVDAGATGFTFGINGGYQIFPKGFAGGWYKLDLNLDASYTSVALFEAAYNGQFGSGKYAADGLSGGSTSIIAFDIMPINRVDFPKFKLLSPYLGLGLGLNLMSTGDVTVGPPNTPGTLTGNSEFKVGLLIFYGVVVRFSDVIQPFLQFKHMIPFGSETVFTDTYTASVAGGGSTKYAFAIQDVPGYFSITAGARFNF